MNDLELQRGDMTLKLSKKQLSLKYVYNGRHSVTHPFDWTLEEMKAIHYWLERTLEGERI
jgi:hypothetical protein